MKHCLFLPSSLNRGEHQTILSVNTSKRMFGVILYPKYTNKWNAMFKTTGAFVKFSKSEACQCKTSSWKLFIRQTFLTMLHINVKYKYFRVCDIKNHLLVDVAEFLRTLTYPEPNFEIGGGGGELLYTPKPSFSSKRSKRNPLKSVDYVQIGRFRS